MKQVLIFGSLILLYILTLISFSAGLKIMAGLFVSIIIAFIIGIIWQMYKDITE
jgi:hypothetical protein